MSVNFIDLMDRVVSGCGADEMPFFQDAVRSTLEWLDAHPAAVPEWGELRETDVIEQAKTVGIDPKRAVEMLLNMGFAVVCDSPNVERLTALITGFTGEAGVWSDDELAIVLDEAGVTAPEADNGQGGLTA